MATEDSFDEEEPTEEEVRETLYDTVDEIVEQMFGHTDEAIS
jgi:phage tail protein X